MPPDTQLVIGPNASLTRSQAWAVMAATGLIGLGIAGVWAALGFWPVLPFAGIELAALGAALYVAQRHNGYREVVTFAGPVVRVEFGRVGDRERSRVEWPRAWTRVRVETGGHRHAPSCLRIEYGSQQVTVGQCLTDAERGRLAVRIRELLPPAGRAAPAGAVRQAVAHQMSSGD